jgi:hypothetical protein
VYLLLLLLLLLPPRSMQIRSGRLASIWQEHLDSSSSGGASSGGSSGSAGFMTDVATQTQRLTLDIVGLTAFSHDFKQVQVCRRDPSHSSVPAVHYSTSCMYSQDINEQTAQCECRNSAAQCSLSSGERA